MISYSKKQALYENLATDYTDVPKLLLSLEKKGFTGVVEVNETRGTGIFLILDGKILGAANDIDKENPRGMGLDAIEELYGLSKEHGGIVHVFQLPFGEVECIAGSFFDTESVFQGLDTDFVNLDGFVRKQQMEQLSGYIELFTRKKEPIGRLSIRVGEVIGMQIADGPDGPCFVDGKIALPLLSELTAGGIFFNVFKNVTTAKTFQEAGDGAEQAADKERFQAASLQERKRNVSKILKTKKSVAPEAVHEKGIFEQRNNGSTATGTEVPSERRPDTRTTVKQRQNGRKELLSGLQRTVGRIERYVDACTENGCFQRVFKRACIEKSESYHFLDPFEGQFQYLGSKIKLDVSVGTEEFVAGVADSLDLALAYVKEGLPRGMKFPVELEDEIAAMFNGYRDILEVQAS